MKVRRMLALLSLSRKIPQRCLQTFFCFKLFFSSEFVSKIWNFLQNTEKHVVDILQNSVLKNFAKFTEKPVPETPF